jgi:hypothetical protein
MRLSNFRVPGMIAGLALLTSIGMMPILPGLADSQSQQIGPDGLPIPPGGTRVGNQVIYNNGNVIMEFAPARGTRALFGPRCPDNWFCIFADAGWEGRMWQFREANVTQNLINFGADNQMTSWDNRLPRYDVLWYYGANGGGTRRCADSNSKNSNVGPTDNDKASSIRIVSNDSQC